MIGITAPEWMDQAACASVGGDYWFPQQGDRASADYARKVCSTCPVLATCLREALERDEQDGIWGGMTRRQRQKLTAGPSEPKPRVVKPIKHGTHSGYLIHRNRGEDACRACKDAEALYGREVRARRRAGAA